MVSGYQYSLRGWALKLGGRDFGGGFYYFFSGKDTTWNLDVEIFYRQLCPVDLYICLFACLFLSLRFLYVTCSAYLCRRRAPLQAWLFGFVYTVWGTMLYPIGISLPCLVYTAMMRYYPGRQGMDGNVPCA